MNKEEVLILIACILFLFAFIGFPIVLKGIVTFNLLHSTVQSSTLDTGNPRPCYN